MATEPQRDAPINDSYYQKGRMEFHTLLSLGRRKNNFDKFIGPFQLYPYEQTPKTAEIFCRRNLSPLSRIFFFRTSHRLSVEILIVSLHSVLSIFSGCSSLIPVHFFSLSKDIWISGRRRKLGSLFLSFGWRLVDTCASLLRRQDFLLMLLSGSWRDLAQAVRNQPDARIQFGKLFVSFTSRNKDYYKTRKSWRDDRLYVCHV